MNSGVNNSKVKKSIVSDTQIESSRVYHSEMSDETSIKSSGVIDSKINDSEVTRSFVKNNSLQVELQIVVFLIIMLRK